MLKIRKLFQKAGSAVLAAALLTGAVSAVLLPLSQSTVQVSAAVTSDNLYSYREGRSEGKFGAVVDKITPKSAKVTLPKTLDRYDVVEVQGRTTDSAVWNVFGSASNDSVKLVSLPSGLAKIGRYAFIHCTALQTVNVPYGVTAIGDRAFAGCSSLKGITLSATVKTLGSGAFDHSGIRTIKVNNPNLDISEAKIPKNATVIAEYDSKAHEYVSAENMKGADFTFQEIVVPTISQTEIALGMKNDGKTDSCKLSAYALSKETNTYEKISWRSSDTKVITVKQDGTVTAVGKGTASVIVSTESGGQRSCKVTVRNAPIDIVLTKGILTLGVGEKFTIGSAIDSGAACCKRVYRSSNSSILKMNRTEWVGEFTAMKTGTAWITVRTYNGLESTCRVTVKPAPTSVKLSQKNLTLKVGQTATLSAIIPNGTGCASRTFTSSNNNIAKMTKTNWTGSFIAVRPGTAVITVRTYNGKTDKRMVKVVAIE